MSIEQELAEARNTIRRLNRRCQQFESGLAVKVEEIQRKGWSLGRALSGAAWAMERYRREQSEAIARRTLSSIAEGLVAPESAAREAIVALDALQNLRLQDLPSAASSPPEPVEP